MKNYFLAAICLFLSNFNYAQYNDAPYRLFGEISTVENHTYRGFISWGGIKNYWIDFFEASKIQNPYSSFFHKGDEVVFHNNGQTFAKPPVHVFCCRFGNIKNIRPTNEQEILLQLKNGQEFSLVKGGSPDINTCIEICTGTGTIAVEWDHISEIHFMKADSSVQPCPINQVAGIVKSSQGIYKGLITWNHSNRMSKEKNTDRNNFLLKMKKIIRPSKSGGEHSLNTLTLEKYPNTPLYTNSGILTPMYNVMINMPNVGCVTVAANRFTELEVIPMSQLTLLSYDDFDLPETIKGTVVSRQKDNISGTLAYDLDENLNIEVLDGKNNNISYRIPFKYIKSIEPKNYKFSFITLRNGSQLSLGEAPDVDRENSGIIIFGEDIPFYIPWNEVRSVILE